MQGYTLCPRISRWQCVRNMCNLNMYQVSPNLHRYHGVVRQQLACWLVIKYSLALERTAGSRQVGKLNTNMTSVNLISIFLKNWPPNYTNSKTLLLICSLNSGVNKGWNCNSGSNGKGGDSSCNNKSKVNNTFFIVERRFWKYRLWEFCYINFGKY